MSRSRNDGTPGWAQVRTRPEPRRCNHRSLIEAELKDLALGLAEERAEEEREQEFWDRYLDREEDRPGLEFWDSILQPEFVPGYEADDLDDYYELY